MSATEFHGLCQVLRAHARLQGDAPGSLSGARALMLLYTHQPSVREPLHQIVRAIVEARAANQPSGLYMPEEAISRVVGLADAGAVFDTQERVTHRWLLTPQQAADRCGQEEPVAARVETLEHVGNALALHDHPSHNVSVVLREGYWEVVPGHLTRALEAEKGPVDGTPVLLEADAARQMAQEISLWAGHELSAGARMKLFEAGVHWRAPGSVVERGATALHRLVVPRHRRAQTLFLTGRRLREWGFVQAGRWTPWSRWLELAA